MTRRIIAASVKFRLLVLMAAAGLLVAGVVTLAHAPVDTYPGFTPPTVEIQTEALGLSAAEIEQLVTVPLQADLLSGVAWLKTMRSESIPGLSSIHLVFEPGTNLLKARQMVQQRLNQPAAIPNVSKPPTMLPPTSSTSRTMMIGLSSETLSLTDIGVLARWTIRPRLLGVPGVANVAIWGGRDRQLQVQIDPEHLKDAGVALDQVVSTAGRPDPAAAGAVPRRARQPVRPASGVVLRRGRRRRPRGGAHRCAGSGVRAVLPGAPAPAGIAGRPLARRPLRAGPQPCDVFAKPALLIVAVLAVAGVVVVPQLRQSPVPLFKETDFLLQLDGPPGTPLPEMDRITGKMTGELRAIPAFAGSAATSHGRSRPTRCRARTSRFCGSACGTVPVTRRRSRPSGRS